MSFAKVLLLLFSRGFCLVHPIVRTWLSPCEPHCGGFQLHHRHTGLVSSREGQRGHPALWSHVWKWVLLSVSELILQQNHPDQPEAVLLLQRVSEGAHSLWTWQPNIWHSIPIVWRGWCVIDKSRWNALKKPLAAPSTSFCVFFPVPGSPPYGLAFESISPSEVNMTWHPPLLPNGVITHYSLELWNSTHYLNLTSQTNSIHIMHLRKYTNYRVVVQAHTHIGPGNHSSEPLNITTLEDGEREGKGKRESGRVCFSAPAHGTNTPWGRKALHYIWLSLFFLFHLIQMPLYKWRLMMLLYRSGCCQDWEAQVIADITSNDWFYFIAVFCFLVPEGFS